MSCAVRRSLLISDELQTAPVGCGEERTGLVFSYLQSAFSFPLSGHNRLPSSKLLLPTRQNLR